MDVPAVLLSEPLARADKFKDAKRVQQSLLAGLEKKTLIWLAECTPAWINSDHLTGLALAAMLAAGLGYWWSSWNRLGLIVVVVALAINWLGDSLDGTLARYRNRQRPRYGFYVDHVCDAFGTAFLLGGLALSGFMNWIVAAGLLLVYLMLLLEVCIATYTLGDFQISFFKFSPTELRIVLAIGTLALWRNPMVTFFGERYPLFDFGGVIAIANMLAVLLVSVARNTARLYREERLP
jgi:archaetidylinositol phosphate synthase